MPLGARLVLPVFIALTVTGAVVAGIEQSYLFMAVLIGLSIWLVVLEFQFESRLRSRPSARDD